MSCSQFINAKVTSVRIERSLCVRFQHIPYFFSVGVDLAMLILAVMLINGCDNKSSAPPPTANARKSFEALQLPKDARTPPTGAIAGSNGIRWLTLAAGTGLRPDERSTVKAELSIWTLNGKLLFSTYSLQGSTTFTMTSLQPFVRQQVKGLGVGGRARAWFPVGTAGSWAQAAWRQSALILEIEMLSIAESSISVIKQTIGSRPYRFVLPEAAGPPVGASAAPEGVRFIYLAHTKATIPPKTVRLRLEITAWQTSGIMLGKPLLRQRQTITTVSQAPSAVARILGGMRIGETVRMWLPPKVATALLPVPANAETIVDVTLVAIK